MKRFVTIAIAVMMIFAIIPFSVSADGEIMFRLSDDKTYYIVSMCDSNDEEIVIPSVYDEKPVKEIGDMAFMSCLNLKTVVIPETVTKISDMAFAYCNSLSLIVIPKSVTYIGDSAFLGCKNLEEIIIGKNVTVIGKDAFKNCKNLSNIYCEAESKPELWDSDWNDSRDENVRWNSNTINITKNLSSISVANGSNVKLSVEAEGVGLSYKWYYKNKNDKAFSLTNTFKSNSYSITMDKTRASRQVYCEITNAFGKTVRTNIATLKMALGITKQPQNVAVQSGKIAKVTVEATGEELNYKWYYKNRNEKEYSLTNTFKGNSYFVEMNGTRASRRVYCVITDKYGNSVRTDTVTLGMAVKLKTHPTSVSVQNGKTAKVTVSASGEGLTYKWYFKNKNDKSFVQTTTFKGNTYSVTMDATRAGRQVYCVVTDKYGNSVKTKTVTLGMAVKITKQPKSVTVANGKEARVTISASGEGLTYKWYYKNKGESKFTLTNTFKGNSYFVTMTNARASRQIYCVITDKYGNSETTNIVTLNKK